MCLSFLCVCVLAAHSCLTLCDPQTVARQAPLPMEFSRQEYWSGLPFSSPGPGDWTWLSCTAGRFLTVFLGQTQFLGSCTWIVDVWVKRNFLSFFIWTILKVFTQFVTILLLFYSGFFFFHGVGWLISGVTWTGLKDDQRTGETVLLVVSLRVSPEDRSIWNDRLSQGDHPCQCEWTAPKCWLPTAAWSICLLPLDTSAAGSQAFGLKLGLHYQPAWFLSLQTAGCGTSRPPCSCEPASIINL